MKPLSRCRAMDDYFVAPLTGAWIETSPAGAYLPIGEVAPLTGAWIETCESMNRVISLSSSHPSRVRGLKPGTTAEVETSPVVAPLTGAWIETNHIISRRACAVVAPLTGAWIETTTTKQPSEIPLSHPSRVRGLKLVLLLFYVEHVGSHPSRVRGLKLTAIITYLCSACRTPHGCVD